MIYLKSELFELVRRNYHLEDEFLFMLVIKKKCENFKYVEHKMIIKATHLVHKLAKENETIRVQSDFGRKAQDILLRNYGKSDLVYEEEDEPNT